MFYVLTASSHEFCFLNLEILTRFRATISLMNYVLQIVLSWTINCSSIVFCLIKKVMKLCCVRDFLRSFAHFMLCFSIICYEIHVKLIHINVRWIETIIYRVILNEMFVCTFSIHVRMFKFCQNVCNDLYFAICDFTHMLKYDEMSLTHVSSFDFFCTF